MLRLLVCLFFHGACISLVLCWNGPLTVINTTVLGLDPQTTNRLNGQSFQQDALVTFNGYQYAVYWVADTADPLIRHVSVSRRALNCAQDRSGSWESLILEDYNQIEDDGHDTISLGFSRGDGTLHIIFDQHDNALHYRSSTLNVTTHPEKHAWTAQLFGPTLNFLPDLQALNRATHFINISYPRFLSIPSDDVDLTLGGTDLLLEMRVGLTGLADEWLYRYTPTKNWTVVGKYLVGIHNNAYTNGLDFDASGKLHVTWTYRDSINDTGQAVQADSNGPENNHDLDYSYSTDMGYSWFNNWQQPVGQLDQLIPVVPNSPGITIFSIPKYSGISNQEGQAVDKDGRIHVLNRENSSGTEQWYHYWRNTTTFWTRTPLPLSIVNITLTPAPTGKRGKLVAPPQSSDLLALLPSNAPGSTGLVILASSAAGLFADWRVVWETQSGFSGEPLYDRYRLDTRGQTGGDGVLSVYYVNGSKICVIDFALTGLD